MGIGWLTVLRSVPWSEVISNAPKVADGARKLWKTVADKASHSEAAGSDTLTSTAAEARPAAALEARVLALAAEVSDLHRQMLASSELIQELANQNAQLIQRIEANRVRVRWLGVATAAVAAIALLGLFGWAGFT